MKKFINKINKFNLNYLRKNHKKFIKNNKSILELQQRCRSKKQYVFTSEVNKITLSGNNDKRIQSTN